MDMNKNNPSLPHPNPQRKPKSKTDQIKTIAFEGILKILHYFLCAF